MSRKAPLLALAGLLAFAGNAVSAPVNPGTLSNLKLWLDASDIDGNGLADTIAAGTAVQTWTDKLTTGNTVANNAVQGTTSLRPIYRSGTTGVLNGKPYLEFAGAGLGNSAYDAMVVANHSDLQPGTGSMTLFAVVDLDGSTNTTAVTHADTVLAKGNQGSNSEGYRLLMVRRDGSVNRHRWHVRVGAVTATNTDNKASQESAVDTTFGTAILGGQINGVASPSVGSVSMYLNGSNSGFANGGAGTPDNTWVNDANGIANTDALTIGYNGFNNGDFGLNGKIAEILIFKGAVSESDFAGVNEYLTAKYVPEPSAPALALVAAACLVRRRCNR